MAGQQRSLLLQTLGASGRKAYGTSYKRGSILENLLVTRSVCISYSCYYYYYYYLSVCLVCQTPKICRVWEGRETLICLPAPHPVFLTLNGPWRYPKGAFVFVVLVKCAHIPVSTRRWPLSSSEAVPLLNGTVFPQRVFRKVEIWSLLYSWSSRLLSKGTSPFIMIIHRGFGICVSTSI